MGRDISKRYSFLFEGKHVSRGLSFLGDAYRTGKSRELASFLVWEILHRLALFPKSAYLKFNPGGVLALTDENPRAQEFDLDLRRAFASHGLCATRLDPNWKQFFVERNGVRWGSIYPDDDRLHRSEDQGRSSKLMWVFDQKVKSIFVSSQGTIFVCTKGALYRSTNHGNTFEKSLSLGSPESFFRFNNGMTETPAGAIVLGEYGNVWGEQGWVNLANLYFTLDNGATWQKSNFLMRTGTNKHVHLVRYSALLDRLLVADGDNLKKLWISKPMQTFQFLDSEWRFANRFHIQTGGYTSVTETFDRIFLGTDYQGGTNFVVETKDGVRFRKRIVPDPYRRNQVDNLLQRKSVHGHEVWAHLACSTPHARGLLMYSRDDGESWDRVIEHAGSGHSVSLISSSLEPRDELCIAIMNLESRDRAVYEISDPRVEGPLQGRESLIQAR